MACPDAKVRDGKKAPDAARKAYDLAKGPNELAALAAAHSSSGNSTKPSGGRPRPRRINTGGGGRSTRTRSRTASSGPAILEPGALGVTDMRLIAAAVVSLIPAVASAQDARPKRVDVDVAIGRGIGFFVKDARAWKQEHDCASCHHASLVICALREARRFGHAVDEPVLAELTKWIAESGDGKFGQARPPDAPKASPKAIYFALALGADPKPDEASQKGLNLILKTVETEQTENGSRSAWPAARPPTFGTSDGSLTALASLAVLPAAAAGDNEAQAAHDKAVKWLAETKTDGDPQSTRCVWFCGRGWPAWPGSGSRY